MKESKYRFILYALVGLVFGVIDWFYLNWLAHLSWGSPGESTLVVASMIGMNYGVWLALIIPVVIYEARHAQRIYYPMLAGILTWSCAVFSYYFYYAALLSLGKLVHFERFNIFGEKDETFWYYYWHMFNGIILSQFIEWIIIAVIGSAIMGALSFRYFHRRSKNLSNGHEKQKRES